jgi:hypothetical protein
LWIEDIAPEDIAAEDIAAEDIAAEVIMAEVIMPVEVLVDPAVDVAGVVVDPLEVVVPLLQAATVRVAAAARPTAVRRAKTFMVRELLQAKGEYGSGHAGSAVWV